MNDFLILFFVSFISSLILTPVVRALCKHLGMIDNPGHRRINKVPIPRGGGLAVVLVMAIVYPLMAKLLNFDLYYEEGSCSFVRAGIIAISIAILGFIDDRFSLRPSLKLIFQIIAAASVYLWAGFGFKSIFPSLPFYLDFPMTVFWIVGAVNAFNLIDGLDGLASGIAFIATLGMAGALWFSGAQTPSVFFHCAFAATLLGFLRYNYNPASIFLGDTGSMFIGFTMAMMPLMFNSPNSFLVSVGVPLLAMGVPIYDTTLAILRRSLRYLIKKKDENEKSNGKVMTADDEHIHHRILRATGFNQRKAAWILYLAAAITVSVGLFGVMLKSKAAGLWVVAVAMATVVVFRSTSHIELFDAARLINSTVHDRSLSTRRFMAHITVPLYAIYDVVALVGAFMFLSSIFSFTGITIESRQIWRMCLLQTFLTFGSLIVFKNYLIVWSRATPGDYFRLVTASVIGASLSGIAVFYLFELPFTNCFIFTVSYTCIVFVLLISIRLLRLILRDFFYRVNSARLIKSTNVSRVLVYGTGLRFRAFYRELVRGHFNANRVIVGLIDDDFLLSNRYVGGYLVCGMLIDAPKLIKKLNVDTVVVACEMTEERKKIVVDILRPTGVDILQFSFTEERLGSSAR